MITVKCLFLLRLRCFLGRLVSFISTANVVVFARMLGLFYRRGILRVHRSERMT